ncbi:MAG: rhomboid family intramembrane serine protease, partial [Armatimonadetes bacterium]|nr:rhomboid family intramembrane serine protease [Armatimonadota bacterium]
MIPIGTDRQTEHFPIATVALIVLNCLVFAVELVLGWSLVENPLVLNPDHFYPWQPITALFAHAGLLHLGGNMLFLWIFGSHAEDALGAKRYLAIYLVAGLAATGLETLVSFVAAHEVVGGLGASGAIMGVLALFVLRFPQVKVRFFYWFYYVYYGTWLVEARWVALFYVGMDLLAGLWQVAMGDLGGVGHWAHLGGFAAGAVAAFKLDLPEEAAEDAARDEIGRLAASGALSLAAAKAIEEADKSPSDVALQELAAAQCAASAFTSAEYLPSSSDR